MKNVVGTRLSIVTTMVVAMASAAFGQIPALSTLKPPALLLTDGTNTIVVDSSQKVYMSRPCNNCSMSAPSVSTGQITWAGTIGAYGVGSIQGSSTGVLSPGTLDVGLNGGLTSNATSGQLTISWTDINMTVGSPFNIVSTNTTAGDCGTSSCFTYYTYVDASNQPFTTGDGTGLAPFGAGTGTPVLTAAASASGAMATTTAAFPSGKYSMTETEVITLLNGAFSLNDFGFNGTAPLTIGNCAAISATAGTAITPVQLMATGGVGNYSFTQSGLPSGLTLSSAGVISGTPIQTGTFTYTVTVSDTAGHTSSSTCAVTVNSNTALPTLSCAYVNAIAGTPIVPVTLVASGWPGIVTYSATGLPTGLTMSAGGTISGTPSVTGSFTYSVTATAPGYTSTSTCSLTVNAAPTACGNFNYPTGSAPTLSSVVFNENTVLQAFAASYAATGNKLIAWYTDEHAPLLGAREVDVVTSGGTTQTMYPFTAYNSSTMSALSPTAPLPVGSISLTGTQAGTDTALDNSSYAYGASYPTNGRPLWPSLFVTDLTSKGATSIAGDWQQGGTSAIPPNAVYGTWKGAVRTVDMTTNPATITVTTDADPAQNGDAGILDSPPGGFTQNLGYTTEAVWNVNALGLMPGHTYRMQVIVHDGDQNKSGGDVGEACVTGITIPYQALSLTCAAGAALTTRAYSSSLTATGGVGPYSYSITGSLPPGLTLNPSTGAITGTPTVAGTYSFTSTVTDSSGNAGLNTATTQCSITVYATPPPVTMLCPTTMASTGQVDSPFNAPAPTVSGGIAPYTFSAAGTLPAGLQVNAATGAVTGTPTAVGSFSLQVTDSIGTSASSACPYSINSYPCLLSSSQLGPAGVFSVLGISGVAGQNKPVITVQAAPGGTGTIGVGSNVTLHVQGATNLASAVFEDTSATITIDKGASITGTQSSESFTAIQNAALSEATALAALTPTQTFSTDITKGTTIMGNGGLNVILLNNAQINLNTGNNLTISGGSSDTFIFNITQGKGLTLANGAGISLVGVSPSQVLFNITGNGNVQIQSGPAGTSNTAGIFLDPQGQINVQGGTHSSLFISGNQVNLQPGPPAPPAPGQPPATATGPTLNAITCPGPTPLTLVCPGSTGMTATPFASALVASGGKPPYTYSTTGSLAPLTLNPSTGAITGTSSTPAVMNFTGAAVDSSGNKATNTVTNACSIALAATPAYSCQIPASQTIISGTSWNKFPTPPGPAPSYVWVHAHIGGASGLSTSTKTTVDFTGVTFTANGQQYAMPDGVLIFDPAAPATPTTVFDPTIGANGTWTTTCRPSNLNDEIFFVGNAIQVDPNISGGGQANFSYTVNSTDPSFAFNWQWSAAAYTYWPVTPGGLPNSGNSLANISPCHGTQHAGTPLNTTCQKSLIGGPRGGGGSNFTGSWSATANATCVGNSR